MQEILIEIIRLIRRVQQHNRFIKQTQSTPISIAASHILIELEAKPGYSIKQLAFLLGLDSSSVSRTCKKLEKQKLIRIKTSKKDSRNKQLETTDKAQALIKEIDLTANQIIDRLNLGLTKTEQNNITLFYQFLADSLEQPKTPKRDKETKYRLEQRRLTRALGLLGENVLNSGYDSSKWHVLGEIVLSPVALNVGELANLLGLAQNSISSIIDFFEKKSFIYRQNSALDQRTVQLIATTNGKKHYLNLEIQAAKIFLKSLKQSDYKKLTEGRDLLYKFVGSLNCIFPPLLPQCNLIKIDSAQLRQKARALAARQLVSLNLEEHIPENFFVSQQDAYLLEKDSVLVGTLIIANNSIVFASWEKNLSNWAMLAFVNAALYNKRIELGSNIEDLIVFSHLINFLKD